MLTTELFIAIIGLCISCFALGYTIGSKETARRKTNRHVLRKLLVIFITWSASLYMSLSIDRISYLPAAVNTYTIYITHLIY